MSKRQVGFLVAKLAFAVAVLTWLFHKVNLKVVLGTLTSAARTEIVLGILLCLGMVFIAGWRWRRLLAIFDIDIPLVSLMCITQIAQFFMMFLPGPTGEVLTRMLYISRLAPGRVGESCTTVLIDRAIGLAAMLALAVACMPWQWTVLATSSQTHWLVLTILIAGVIVCLFGILFFVAGHPTQRWFERRLRSLPAHSLRDEAARIWGLLCANKMAVAQVSATAIITQLLYCVLFYLAGRSVGIRLSVFMWVTFVPIVLLATSLPISFSGLGVREYLLVLFLGVTGQIESERALAASVVVFSIIVVVSLVGGVLYIFYRPRKKQPDPPAEAVLSA